MRMGRFHLTYKPLGEDSPMCKNIAGKELTLPQILDRLQAKKHQRQLVASSQLVTYSRQEIDSARTVLDRLLVAIPSSGRDSILPHHTKIRI